jgi:tetratricopeptide (TPR) repeat protein
MRFRHLVLLILVGTSIQLVAAQIHSSAQAAKNKTVLSPDELLMQANQFYANKQFDQAIPLYESLLSQYGPSFTVYYNLGNAYYKKGELAKAILQYERALRIKPGDQDTRFNLQVCQARTVDKIDTVGVFLVTRWFRSLGNMLSSNHWAWISLISFTLLIGFLFAYFFSRTAWLKKTGFYVSILLLILTILSLVYASNKYHEMVHPDQAILMEPTVTVKSSPDEMGTDLFTLHEGTKVTLRNEVGSWKEIELQDGNVGWVPASSLEII